MFVPDIALGRWWQRVPPRQTLHRQVSGSSNCAGPWRRSPVQVNASAPLASTCPTSAPQRGSLAEQALAQKQQGMETQPRKAPRRSPNVGFAPPGKVHVSCSRAETRNSHWEEGEKSSAVPSGLSRQTYIPAPASFPLPSSWAGSQETVRLPALLAVLLTRTHPWLGRGAEVLGDTGTAPPSTATLCHLPGMAC